MASHPKKRKLSKREKKAIMSEKGKKSAESRGKGVHSREEFALPAKWKRDIRQGETREIVDYYSPGKTKYCTQAKVKKVLRQRGMKLCFDESDSPSEDNNSNDSDDYDPNEEIDCEPSTSQTTETKKCKQLEVEQRLFVCESTQLCKFVDDINKTSRCSTTECNGKHTCMFYFFFSVNLMKCEAWSKTNKRPYWPSLSLAQVAI